MFNNDQDISFKDIKLLFFPLTTKKAMCIIVVVGFVVFANIFFNNFVMDDIVFILTNSGIHNFNFPYLIGGNNNIFNSIGQYRPISAIYFSLLYSLFREVSFFYHFSQLILHIANTVLIWFLLKKFFSKSISIFTALLFLTHPIQVESVSYIAASDNPLFFLFGVGALLLSTKEVISKKRLLATCGLVLCSILTKETGIVFIVCIISYRMLFINKRQIVQFTIGIIITLLIYCGLRFGLEHIYFTKISDVPIASLPLTERVINIPLIVLYYLQTFFFPVDLSIQQYWVIKQITVSNFYKPLLIEIIFFSFVGFLGGYIFTHSKKYFSTFLFFLVWFLVGLGIHIQLFPLDGTVAERWFYFPILGLLGILTSGIQGIKYIPQKIVKIGYVLIVSIIVLLSLRTMIRNENWSNQENLYVHDQKFIQDYMTENYFGVTYDLMQRYPEALKHFKISVALFPTELTFCNIGNTYLKMGNPKQAAYFCLKALETPLQNRKAHNEFTYERIAIADIMLNKFEDAKKVLQSGVSNYPDSGNLLAMLAISDYKLGLRTEALHAAKKAKTKQSFLRTDYIYETIKDDKQLQM